MEQIKYISFDVLLIFGILVVLIILIAAVASSTKSNKMWVNETTCNETRTVCFSQNIWITQTP